MTVLANPTSDLTQLAGRQPEHGVSVLLPMHVAGPQTTQNSTMLKSALSQAQTQLHERGVAEESIADILAPAVALLDDHDFWQHQAAGLALFLEAGEPLVALSVPLELTEHVAVASRFHIAPLLPLLGSGASYLVLTATASEARLFRATRTTLSEIADAGLPSQPLADGTENDYENPVQASPPLRPNTGSATISNAQVYGDAPPEWRDTRREDHALQISRVLDSLTAERRDPVVLVASADMLGRLRPTGLFAADVETNPEALSEDELQERTLEAVKEVLDADDTARLEELSTLRGRGDSRVVDDLSDIHQAAIEARVDTLYAAESRLHTADEEFAEIVAHVIGLGGRIQITTDEAAPSGVAAVLRY